MWGVRLFCRLYEVPMSDISQMTDEELVAVPEKTRDGNLATTATLEMLRRLKQSVDNLLVALQAKGAGE